MRAYHAQLILQAFGAGIPCTNELLAFCPHPPTGNKLELFWLKNA